MKKVLLLSLIFAFATMAQAQTSDKKIGVGGGFGAYGTLKNGGIGIMPELYLSRYLSPKLDVMFKPELGILRTGMKSKLDLATYYFNLRYKLTDESKNLRPYIFAGPGFLLDNRTSGINFDLGFGLKNYKNPKFITYLDAGYIYGVDSKSIAREDIWKVTAGAEIDFGKVKDADLDGVSDKKDKCPDTPAGVVVDANGCPIDTDGDGVADYMDDCQTVAGLTSLKGCPDADKDGVADKDDACPNVAGIASFKGCPDTDGDGVADKDDKCADTKKGWKVDASGCPLDQDKDGIIDSEDDCPAVAGTKDNKGCPVKEPTAIEIEAKKMKAEPVYFDSSKPNYISSEKTKIDKLVNLLKENATYNVNVIGYADSSGNINSNMTLSKNRASSVVKAIKAAGIKRNRITSQKGLGISNPAASNDIPAGRALNRRVEFEVIKAQ